MVEDSLVSRKIRVLTKSGVTVAIGSDNRRVFVPGEIKHIARLGELREGFEASFLALENNPLEDLNHLDKISMRVKQGHILKD